MPKSMLTMNVQLWNAISDISGGTGQASIRGTLAGERGTAKPAKFRDGRFKGRDA